jgi:hypothetical protein
MFTGDPDDPSLSKDERRRIRRCPLLLEQALLASWCSIGCRCRRP